MGTEHPLIFSAEMVRAILAGRKTVTRRLADSKWKKGDTVWVREKWIHYQIVHQMKLSNGGYLDEIGDGQAAYAADGHGSIAGFKSDTKGIMGADCIAVEVNGGRFRPSIHMPRWASRITLELTEDVRREKLNIGDVDYRKEGFLSQVEFFNLWDEMHPDHSWRSNPIVSIINFKVIQP